MQIKRLRWSEKRSGLLNNRGINESIINHHSHSSSRARKYAAISLAAAELALVTTMPPTLKQHEQPPVIMRQVFSPAQFKLLFPSMLRANDEWEWLQIYTPPYPVSAAEYFKRNGSEVNKRLDSSLNFVREAEEAARKSGNAGVLKEANTVRKTLENASRAAADATRAPVRAAEAIEEAGRPLAEFAKNLRNELFHLREINSYHERMVSTGSLPPKDAPRTRTHNEDIGWAERILKLARDKGISRWACNAIEFNVEVIRLYGPSSPIYQTSIKVLKNVEATIR